jgi:hypothetical protein
MGASSDTRAGGAVGLLSGGEKREQIPVRRRVFFSLFFKWKQDYGTLSPTEGIFHLLLSDWALVTYMLN